MALPVPLGSNSFTVITYYVGELVCRNTRRDVPYSCSTNLIVAKVECKVCNLFGCQVSVINVIPCNFSFNKSSVTDNSLQLKAITSARTKLNNLVDCFIKFYLHILVRQYKNTRALTVNTPDRSYALSAVKNISVAQSPFLRFPKLV